MYARRRGSSNHTATTAGDQRRMHKLPFLPDHFQGPPLNRVGHSDLTETPRNLTPGQWAYKDALYEALFSLPLDMDLSDGFPKSSNFFQFKRLCC